MYGYKCTNKKCEHEFEEIQNIKEKPLKKCPKCKKNTLKRLIGNTSFVLKGGGWTPKFYK
jgi:putative FmdB family regulatory protein